MKHLAYRLPFLLASCWLLSVLPISAQTGTERGELSRELDRLNELISREKYKDALLLSDTLMARTVSLLGDNAPDTLFVRALATRGRALFFNGKYDDAIACHERCLPFNRRIFGEESVAVARSLTNIGICHYEKKEPLPAIRFHQQALDICLKQNDPWLPVMADCWSNLANAQADNQQNDLALKSYDEALRIRYHNEGQNGAGVARVYQNMAGCYIALNQLAEAVRWYEAALLIYQQNKNEKPASQGDIWHNLGSCYLTMGDMEYALFCNEQALSWRKIAFTNDNHPKVLVSLRGLALVYQRMGDEKRAAEYFDLVLELRRRSLKPGNRDLSNSITDASVAARQGGYLKRAEQLAREVIGIEQGAPVPDSLRIARVLGNYGTFLYETGQPDSALILHRQALDFYPRTKESESGRANCYTNIGACYLLKNDLARADSFIRLTLRILDVPGTKSIPTLAFSIRQLAGCSMRRGRYATADSMLARIFTLMEVSDRDTSHWENVRLPVVLINTLLERARLYYRWGLAANDPARLNDAIYWGEIVLNYIPRWEKKLALTSSLRSTRELARQAHELCVDAAFQLKERNPAQRSAWLEKAFGHIEATHHSQLYDILLDAKNRRPAGITDQAMGEQFKLKSSIAQLERDIHFARLTGIAGSPLGKKLDSLIREKNQLDSLLRLNTGLLPLRSRGVTLSEVRQTLLRPGQTLLEYLVTDSVIYIFCVNRRLADLVAVRRDFDLDTTVARLRQGITGYFIRSDKTSAPNLYERSLDDYLKSAVLLYREIFAPILPGLGTDTDVLIVADGMLHLVPFQALLPDNPALRSDFATYPFLIRKYNFGTAFSAALQQEMSAKPPSSGAFPKAVVMAPFFTGDTSLLPNILPAGSKSRADQDTLLYSGVEAFKIGRILPGSKVTYGNAAALDSFLLWAPAYEILHLSTHTVADRHFGEYCYVLFEKKDGVYRRLYVADIYRLQLRAELATLSSCESAVGELQPGEGLIGLTRAFAHAGAKSIIASLWPVKDEVTADLMERLYEKLIDPKLTRDQALGASTREFLNDINVSNEKKHPYFWAAFTLTGRQSPLR